MPMIGRISHISVDESKQVNLVLFHIHVVSGFIDSIIRMSSLNQSLMSILSL